MSSSSPKRPKPAKCRKTGALLEGRDWLRIGGSKWLREAAEKEGKYIPLEYREGYVAKKKAAAPAAEAPAETAEAQAE
ncbi:MAG: hypothetical protein K6G50_00790 [bacterium]|nr:hypothetical protein [bacterium]